MRILLIGYGKMGKAIEQIAIERNNTIVAAIDKDNYSDFDKLSKDDVDVAIEFSQPSSAYDNIKKCLEKNIPIVSGTTGWLDKRDEIESICKNHNGSFFYASNFSIGVNVFFKLNEQLAQIMNKYNDYDVNMQEVHHTEKKDAPSGTAITLAEGVINHIDGKNKWINEKGGNTDEVAIESLRIDKTPGTHTVTYESDIDSIEIKHTAHTRRGFALGAVLVAEWLPSQKGILNFEDFLKV